MNRDRPDGVSQSPSWRQRRWPQPVNEAQELGEQRSWDGKLRQLESEKAAVAHDRGAALPPSQKLAGLAELLQKQRMPKAQGMGSLEVPQGLGQFTFLLVRESPVGEDMGIAGLQADGLIVVGDGPVPQAFSLVGESPVREGLGKIFPDPD